MERGYISTTAGNWTLTSGSSSPWHSNYTELSRPQFSNDMFKLSKVWLSMSCLHYYHFSSSDSSVRMGVICTFILCYTSLYELLPTVMICTRVFAPHILWTGMNPIFIYDSREVSIVYLFEAQSALFCFSYGFSTWSFTYFT
jgi:hypothetical protein